MTPDDPTTPPSPDPDSPKPPALKPWFTADELPKPPAWMRRPPGEEEEPTLFDYVEE